MPTKLLDARNNSRYVCFHPGLRNYVTRVTQLRNQPDWPTDQTVWCTLDQNYIYLALLAPEYFNSKISVVNFYWLVFRETIVVTGIPSSSVKRCDSNKFLELRLIWKILKYFPVVMSELSKDGIIYPCLVV